MNKAEAKKLKAMEDFLLKDYLANDEPFGVLTRPALEVVMSSCKGPNKLYIVDFQDIHKNEQYLRVSSCE